MFRGTIMRPDVEAKATQGGRAVRAHVLDAVAERPGQTLIELCQSLALTAARIRYHLSVMESRGEIRRLLVRGQWHYFRASADLLRAKGKILLEKDDKVREALRRVSSGGTPAHELVRHLMKEYGLTRSGAWGVLRRAIHAGVIRRHAVGQLAVLTPGRPPNGAA